jgi:molybdopterin-guanine dinucleotide biosynthesis protein A
MIELQPFPVAGYVLAGGHSSRMGTDKTLLQLAGKPLIQRAVGKLCGTCAEVHILSGNPALAAYAPLVPDIHPNCGPIGGMEAALTHSRYDWNLFIAVDTPFLPAAFVAVWVRQWLQNGDDGARIRMFSADGRPQPSFCLLHRDVLPFLSHAIGQGDRKLMRVFEAAGRELALRPGYPPAAGLWVGSVTDMLTNELRITKAQQDAKALWFANLNTPEDLASTEAHADALDA